MVRWRNACVLQPLTCRPSMRTATQQYHVMCCPRPRGPAAPAAPAARPCQPLHLPRAHTHLCRQSADHEWEVALVELDLLLAGVVVGRGLVHTVVVQHHHALGPEGAGERGKGGDEGRGGNGEGKARVQRGRSRERLHAPILKMVHFGWFVSSLQHHSGPTGCAGAGSAPRRGGGFSHAWVVEGDDLHATCREDGRVVEHVLCA